MTALEVRGVSVSFGEARVLDGVSLSVAPGAWLGLIGPNGAGKTTLLRAITGLVSCEGDVLLDGTPASALSRRERARRIALVPQRPLIPPGMTVTDYVLTGRSPYIGYLDVENANDLAIVAEALARLDVASFADRPLGSLSGGEQQRVILARALAQQAPILLLDEGTSALDVGSQQEVLELVETLRRADGLTVLSAMHDLTLAAQYADELVLLDGGRVAAAGEPRAVLTEEVIRAHYGASVRVLSEPDGTIAVLPVRARVETGP